VNDQPSTINHQPIEPPWLLTIEEAARLCGVAKSTMEVWVADQTVASFLKGRARRISREELARFVLLNTLKPKKPEWLTEEMVPNFRRLIGEIVATEVEKCLREQRLAA